MRQDPKSTRSHSVANQAARGSDMAAVSDLRPPVPDPMQLPSPPAACLLESIVCMKTLASGMPLQFVSDFE